MKVWKKIAISAAIIVTVMLIFPWLTVQFAPPMAAMSWFMLLFFIICPLGVISLGILSGTAMDKLWWIPIFSALIFPVCFWAVIGEWVFELFVYSAMYLCVGVIAMLGTHFGISASKSREDGKDKQS